MKTKKKIFENTLMILTETILFVREIFAVVKAIASTCDIDAQQLIRAKKFGIFTFAYVIITII